MVTEACVIIDFLSQYLVNMIHSMSHDHLKKLNFLEHKMYTLLFMTNTVYIQNFHRQASGVSQSYAHIHQFASK